jgi:hypothetical protein
MNSKFKPKYRPALTEDALRELYSDCREGETKEYLRQYLIKIGAGITNASYALTSTPRSKSVEDSLGFSSHSPSSTESFIPSQEYKESLYQKYQDDPMQLTSSELEIVQTFRFENDLMSASEEQLYLNQLMA